MNLLDSSSNPGIHLLLALLLFSPLLLISSRNLDIKQHQQLDHDDGDDSPTYIWPLPWQYTFDNRTLTVDPNLTLVAGGNGGRSLILSEAFDRYKGIIFKHTSSELPGTVIDYDLNKLSVIVHTEDEQLQLGLDESYTLMVAASDGLSVVGDITIECNISAVLQIVIIGGASLSHALATISNPLLSEIAVPVLNPMSTDFEPFDS